MLIYMYLVLTVSGARQYRARERFQNLDFESQRSAFIVTALNMQPHHSIIVEYVLFISPTSSRDFRFTTFIIASLTVDTVERSPPR